MFNDSFRKDLRKQEKKLREINVLKSKPYDQLNKDQKNKIMTEREVNRQIRRLEALCEKQNNPKQIEQPIPEKKIVRKKKKKIVRKKKNNKMTNEQRKAYETHKELSKKERQEYKEEQLWRNMKKMYFRIRRQQYKIYLQQCAQWKRQIDIMNRRQINNTTEQTV
jgi:hypothetical protein